LGNWASKGWAVWVWWRLTSLIVYLFIYLFIYLFASTLNKSPFLSWHPFAGYSTLQTRCAMGLIIKILRDRESFPKLWCGGYGIKNKIK